MNLYPLNCALLSQISYINPCYWKTVSFCWVTFMNFLCKYCFPCHLAVILPFKSLYFLVSSAILNHALCQYFLYYSFCSHKSVRVQQIAKRKIFSITVTSFKISWNNGDQNHLWQINPNHFYNKTYFLSSGYHK